MEKLDLNNLEDNQVKDLIEELKYPESHIDESELKTLVASRIDQRQDVVSFKLGVKYFLVIKRGNIEIDRFSISIIFAETYHTLVRICVNSGTHDNPDGTVAPKSHIHIYNNSYEKKDSYAYAIDLKEFPNVYNVYSAYVSFLAYNNVKELEFSNLSNNVVRIDSPFKDSSLDNLVIYAIYDQTNDLITLTDDGYTIFGLENNGVFINKSKKRKNIFEEHLSPYGIKYNDKTEEIYIKTNYKNFNKSKHNLLQCLIFVNDMYILSKPKVQNIFSEDVAIKLDEHNISYGRDLPIVGKSGVVHSFDFFISANKNQKEKFINAIANPNNPMIIKSKLTDAVQAKKIKRQRPNEFIFILNDTNKEVNLQNKSFLHENDIKTIDYSELDQKIELLI